MPIPESGTSDIQPSQPIITTEASATASATLNVSDLKPPTESTEITVGDQLVKVDKLTFDEAVNLIKIIKNANLDVSKEDFQKLLNNVKSTFGKDTHNICKMTKFVIASGKSLDKESFSNLTENLNAYKLKYILSQNPELKDKLTNKQIGSIIESYEPYEFNFENYGSESIEAEKMKSLCEKAVENPDELSDKALFRVLLLHPDKVKSYNTDQLKRSINVLTKTKTSNMRNMLINVIHEQMKDSYKQNNINKDVYVNLLATLHVYRLANVEVEDQSLLNEINTEVVEVGNKAILEAANRDAHRIRGSMPSSSMAWGASGGGDAGAVIILFSYTLGAIFKPMAVSNNVSKLENIFLSQMSERPNDSTFNPTQMELETYAHLRATGNAVKGLNKTQREVFEKKLGEDENLKAMQKNVKNIINKNRGKAALGTILTIGFGFLFT